MKKKPASRQKAKSKATQAKQAIQNAAAMAAMQGGGINPEVQAQQISLQPADGYVNPYRALGTVQPGPYSAGNMLNGGTVGMPTYGG